MCPLVPTGVRQVLCLTEIERMSKEVQELTGQLNSIEALYTVRVYKGRVKRLFSRIDSLRRFDYRGQIHLEADQIKAVELWGSINSSLETEIEKRAKIIKSEFSSLKLEIESSRDWLEVIMGEVNSLNPLKKRISNYKTQVSNLDKYLNDYLIPLDNSLNALEERLFLSEYALNNAKKSVFKLKDDETPIIAVKAKDANAKIAVLLILTNQRMLCESVRTERTEQKAYLEAPVGSVDKFAKAKLGLFAGEGLCVEFKPPNDSKLKFSLEGKDADLAVQYFDLITSGQIDGEIKVGIDVTTSEHFKELAHSWAEAEENAAKQDQKEVFEKKADTINIQQEKACVCCGKDLGNQKPYGKEKDLELIYEEFPQYKDKQFCQTCGNQYRQAAFVKKKQKSKF